MSNPTNLPKYVVIISGILILLWGLGGLTLPAAQADVIVPLVRNTPPDEVYTLVSRKLAEAMHTYYLVFVVLGLVNVVAALVDRRNHKKNVSIA